jgi:hypothetical protein
VTIDYIDIDHCIESDLNKGTEQRKHSIYLDENSHVPGSDPNPDPNNDENKGMRQT